MDGMSEDFSCYYSIRCLYNQTVVDRISWYILFNESLKCP